MKTQNYKNHIRFYVPHHFVFYPFVTIALIVSIYVASEEKQLQMVWFFMALVLALFLWLAFMMRQHYALTLQDRIVRLELNYRYFSLTGNKLEIVGKDLDDSQLFALRFAPDEELVKLVELAVTEKMSGDTIKKSIKNWKGDYHRV